MLKKSFQNLHLNILLFFVLLAGAGLASFPAPTLAAPPDQVDSYEIFGRDVFVIVGSTLRNPNETTAADAPLFNIAGVGLEQTWGDWQNATPTSQARVKGGNKHASTDFRIELKGLIPGGVYSIFYGTIGPDSENALCPDVERTLPLTRAKPDANAPDSSSFVADAKGEMDFHGKVDGNLFEATQVFYSVIYHFDGMTYGSLPNRGEYLTQGENCRSSFGEDAMRQLLVIQKFQ